MTTEQARELLLTHLARVSALSAKASWHDPISEITFTVNVPYHTMPEFLEAWGIHCRAYNEESAAVRTATDARSTTEATTGIAT